MSKTRNKIISPLDNPNLFKSRLKNIVKDVEGYTDEKFEVISEMFITKMMEEKLEEDKYVQNKTKMDELVFTKEVE